MFYYIWKITIYISIFLESQGFRSRQELAAMSYGDQRNTLVVEVNILTGDNIQYLSGLGDFDLFQKGYNILGRVLEVTIKNWLFLPDHITHEKERK